MKCLRTASFIIGLIVIFAGLMGCSSSNGIIAPSEVLDTAPPAVPTALAASAGRSTVRLTWHRNTTDADLAGYMVYRLAYGQAWPLTDSPITAIGFVDRMPNSGYSTYAVNAVDTAGNESAWVTIVYNYHPVRLERSQ